VPGFSSTPSIRSFDPIAPGALVARSVSYTRGVRIVLAGVSLTVGPGACVGVTGPNGVGKSTLLRLLAGLEAPDSGSITLDPPTATVGYLTQEHEQVPGESVRALLTRRTGARAAEDELASAASGLANGGRVAEARYETALERFTALGAGDLDARIDAVLNDLGLTSSMADRKTSDLSGGQEAKLALAAIELSRFSITLLDEPTNDLDFEGLGRLQAWIERRQGGMVIVSHDRVFLEQTVSTVLELDEHDHTAREFGGGWSGYLAERATSRRHAEEAFGVYDRNRSDLHERADRQRQWATKGVAREARSPRDNDKAQRGFRIERTEKLASKARSTERALAALEKVEKPWEGWDLRFTIEEVARAGHVVVRLTEAVVERGTECGDRGAGPGPSGVGWDARPGPRRLRPLRPDRVGGPITAGQVRTRGRTGDPTGGHPVSWRADPSRARHVSGAGGQFPGPRRADQPPRPPGHRAAGVSPRVLHRHAAVGVPRPADARVGRSHQDPGPRLSGLPGRAWRSVA
jgi:ABC-type multidrug transport system ATPase subunit